MSVVLRLPPYPLTVKYTVPDANAKYVIVVEDVAEQSETTSYRTSNASKQVTYTLDDDFIKYDKSYALTIYEDLEESGMVVADRGDIVVEDNLEVKRPYVSPTLLAAANNQTSATEIAKYAEYENLARSIIDSITGGFYYEREFVEIVGQEVDYIPLWKKVHKILRVYENTELVYDIYNADGPTVGDYTYVITKDKTALTKDPTAAEGAINRAEQRPARMPLGTSDSFSLFDTEDSGNTMTVTPGVAFPAGIDLILLLETGYKVVPIDIQDATKLLVEDIRCGKLDYYKRYIKNYSTDQFKIQYDARMIEGTGNIIVDKILSKYVNNISRPGVL
jgi:hypothetical protein